MAEIKYNFSIDNIDATDNYADLRAQLSRINAKIAEGSYIFDPNKSEIIRHKELFREKLENQSNERYFYGIVLELRDSDIMPSIVEVFVDVPGINQKTIDHPDLFASTNIDLNYFEDLIYYHVDTYQSRNILPIQGGICAVQLSNFYPNHRQVDKFGNKYIGMISETPYITPSKDIQRLNFSVPKNFGYQPFQGGYAGGSVPIVYSSFVASGQNPFVGTKGERTNFTITRVAGKEKASIAKPEKPNGKKVLLIGDSHVAAPDGPKTGMRFGPSIMKYLASYGYEVLRVAQGGAHIRSFYQNWGTGTPAARDQGTYKKELRETISVASFDIAIMNYGTNDIASDMTRGLENSGAKKIIENFKKLRSEIKATTHYWIMPPLFSVTGADRMADYNYTAKGLNLNLREEALEKYVDEERITDTKILKIKYVMQRPSYKADLDKVSVHDVHFYGELSDATAAFVGYYVANGKEIRQASDVDQSFYPLASKILK